MNEQLQSQVHPGGRPVQSGWMSSAFGYRTDPLSGKRAFHAGVDFAGRAGSAVLAVASGVVVTSRYREAMGNMVEINHGGGYVTRYAHNKKNLVKVGDTVKKGQKIAIMEIVVVPLDPMFTLKCYTTVSRSTPSNTYATIPDCSRFAAVSRGTQVPKRRLDKFSRKPNILFR